MRSRALAVGALAALAVAGCGERDGRPTIRVAAAASLAPALRAYGAGFGPARAALGFAGSDALAAQVRRGAGIDVFAAADPALTAALHREGLVERPLAFARNRLVVAVPAGASTVRAVADLGRAGVTVALGSPSVPVGAYARRALALLGPARARAIRANVRSLEPDSAGIVGKVAAGAVDAGFVYATDVRASRGRLRAVELPPGARVDVVYAAAVVTASGERRRARAFVAGLAGEPGRRALRAAGFEPVRR